MSDDIVEAIGADIVIDTDAIDVGHLVAEHRAAIIEIKRLRADLAVAVGAFETWTWRSLTTGATSSTTPSSRLSRTPCAAY